MCALIYIQFIHIYGGSDNNTNFHAKHISQLKVKLIKRMSKTYEGAMLSENNMWMKKYIEQLLTKVDNTGRTYMSNVLEYKQIREPACKFDY